MTLAPPDQIAALALWDEYIQTHPGLALADEVPVAEHFGDNSALADALLDLVLSGQKRATATLALEFRLEGQDLPRIGSHWIACDGAGVPRAILRTLELRLGALDSADPDFAWDEGEDDRSLESWLREHTRYWRRICASRDIEWDEGLEIVFERFCVVWPPAHADPSGQG